MFHIQLGNWLSVVDVNSNMYTRGLENLISERFLDYTFTTINISLFYVPESNKLGKVRTVHTFWRF